MLPDHPPASALLLGLGGGTIAHLLVRRFGPIALIGVEDSQTILDFASEFELETLPLRVVLCDAFAFVHGCKERFDYIAVDLYRGNHLVRGVLALPFLRALAARLQPGGTVAYNLFSDDVFAARVARLERVFDRVRVTEVGANAVFLGRPHRHQR